MRRRMIYALGVCCTAALLLSGCSSSSTYGKYMTLGEYKGLEVTKIKSEITDEVLDEELEYTLEDNAEYTEVDRAAKDGDMVNIDCQSTLDGELLEDASMEGADLELGQGYLEGDILEGAEEELIGMKAGETKDVDLTIPEDYFYDEELAGKKIQVSLTMNTVYEVYRPELTDEFVASISEYDTVDAYKEALRQSLLESTEENNAYTAGSDALIQVVQNSTFKGYPDELYNECKEILDQTNAAYAEMFGMDVEDFAMSDEDTKETVESMVYEDMVVTAIAEKEKLSVSDDEYTEYIQNNLENYGMSSLEEFEATYSKESVMDELLREKVQNFLLDNATITEVTEDEYYQEYYGDDGFLEDDIIDLDAEEGDDSESGENSTDTTE